MEEALFLTRFANSVKIVHRRDEFRASKIMQEKVLHDPKISAIWNAVVEELKGEQNEVETEIDGVFVAGDVYDSYYRQAVTASAGGVKAALKVREHFSR